MDSDAIELRARLRDALDLLPSVCFKRIMESPEPPSIILLKSPARPCELDVLRYHKVLLELVKAVPDRIPDAKEVVAPALEAWDDSYANVISKVHGRRRKDIRQTLLPW